MLVGYLAAIVGASITGGVAAVVAGDSEGVVVLAAGQIGFWAVLASTVLYAQRNTPETIVRRPRLELRWTDTYGIGIGIGTQLALLPALYAPFQAFFEREDLSGPAEDLLERVDGPGLVAMGFGVVVIAPIVEELFFRGLLLQTMQRRWGVPLAVIGSSVFFGATHFQPLLFPGLTLAGAVFALAVVRTGRLGSAIAVHAGFNATTFVALTILS